MRDLSEKDKEIKGCGDDRKNMVQGGKWGMSLWGGTAAKSLFASLLG